MKITALEIKQQNFEKSFRGYDVNEVHSFLKLVADEWEELVSKKRELEREVAQLKEKVKHFEKVEDALHDTLQSAKESAEQRLTTANREAESKIEKAEMEAARIVTQAQQQRQEVRQSILRLIDRRDEIIRGIRSYLDMASESLNSFARDDASIYQLPGQDRYGDPAPPKRKAEEKKPSSNDQTKADVPGTDNLDDILDELD